ncbi:hypothetical protein EGT07_23740 [Herbaspirillum sp. HC18]|nr:hypothetical protein EGT07_23740 [Herbaspirillum sp. HC18]
MITCTHSDLKNRIRILLCLFLVSLLLAPQISAFAAAPDLAEYEPIRSGFESFLGKVATITKLAINAPDYVIAVDRLWMFFAILLLIWTGFKFAFKGAEFQEWLAIAIMAMMTRVLISTYDTLTAGIWEFGSGVGAAIQLAMVGNDELFFGPKFIVELVKQITLPTYGLLDIFAALYGALAALIVGVLSIVLSVMAFVASIWGLWGYTLSKVIGLLFVPFLLYERLSFLFDGWLRFFFGFVIYGLVARVNTVLVVVALSMYYGIPVPPSGGMATIPIPAISSITELLGLATFAMVGIIALASTGRFAATILSGAGGGGIGLAASQFARSVASVALGKK